MNLSPVILSHVCDPNQYFFNPHAVPLFLSAGLIILLGWRVVAGPRSKLRLLFGAVCLSIVAWLFFTAMGYLVREDPALASFWFQLDWVGVSFISINVYAFTAALLGRKDDALVRLGYGLAGFFALTTLIWNPQMQGVRRYGWGFFPQHDYVWSPIFFVYFFGYMLYAFAAYVQAFRKTEDPIRRNQIKYMFAAFLIAYLGSIDYLSTYGVAVYPLGFVFISLFVGITAYAILRHHLLDINIVIRKTLLYSVISAGLAAIYVGVVTLLARLLESPENIPILMSADIFGWLRNQIFFAYSLQATALISFFFGLFVQAKGPRKSVNTLWFLTCMSIGMWSWCVGMMVKSSSYANAIYWGNLEYVAVLFIPVLFLHFVGAVLKKRLNAMLAAGYSLVVLQQILNARGLLQDVQPHLPTFNYYTVPKGAYWLFAVYFFSFVGYAHFLLIREMRYADSQLRNQIKYIVLGMSIGFCGGSTAFFYVFNIPIYPGGVYLVPVYVITVSYAIYRHQLMDINLVVRKTLIYSLLSAALAAVYVGTITLLAHTLGGRHGSTSALSSAVAAIFITVLFNPLRTRTQRWINRYFPRERLDPGLLQEAAGGFAHEMKRPLSKISLPAQLTLMDLERIDSGEESWKESYPVLKQRLQYIIDQSMDAGYMIEAIRELSTPGAPAEEQNLPMVIQQALAAQDDLLEKNAVQVRMDLSPDLPQIAGRARQLEIVFINLIKNAVEAMSGLPEGSLKEIHIEARLSENGITVRFQDSGAGIKPEDLGKVFQPNYTTKGSRGTGMGLYLSRQIIEAHHGALTVESQLGHGTTFIIKLPKRNLH